MGGRAKVPVAVLQARGKKHLGKAEIKARSESELKPLEGNLDPPDYLTKKQKDDFNKIADQLQRLKIMGETDVDALARYVVANESFIFATKQLKKAEVKKSPALYESWSKVQERYFKIVRASANDLGLTISSRCKLVVPVKTEEAPKTNKFKQFEKSVI